MGLDAKDVGILLWKILRVSTNSVYTYVRKYPIVSSVSTFIFLLYTFLPRLFFFLLYSSPLIACSVFYLRNHLYPKPLMVNESSPTTESEDGTRKADLKHQRSVRRNARRKVEEVGKDWDSSQASEDERDKVILTTLYGEIPNTKESPELQKYKKDRGFLVSEDFSVESSIEEETPSTSTVENVSVVDPLEMLTSGGGETEIECSSSSEGENEETNREESKTVLTWTEDDQKNLMDLGNSEMERNKRLEHLITRRRTRRLFLLAAQKSLMDMEVPTICIGRNYFSLDRDNYMVDGLEMPESAPSVLLPTKNPFDLPYDAQEEKPNLLGDSFQQEFSEPNPNDIVFCHHQSFGRRVFPSEFQVESSLEPWRKAINDWPRPQQGTNDRLVGEEPPVTEGEDVIRGEANDTGIVVNDSSSLVSPEEKEMDANVILNQEESSGHVAKRNGVGNSLVGVVPRNTGSLSSSLAAERKIYMEHFGYSTIKGHKITQSVESDLQVEFSEIGSPPLSVDGNNSSDDEKSLIIDEQDFSGVENEAEQKSIVDQIGESQMLPVERLDQDINETSSIVSQETDAAKQFEGLSDGTNFNGKFEEEEKLNSIHSLQESSDRGLLVPEEDTVPHTDEVILQREEESQELLQNSVDETNISHDSDKPETLERRTNQEFAETLSGGQTTQDTQEVVEAEASNVNEVESTTSPRSLLPDLSLPLDQTYSLTSENSELTSVGDLQESSDRGLLIPEEGTIPHTDEVIPQKEEESHELLQNSVGETNISHDGEPETSGNRTSQELEGQSTQEMQELVEAETLDVNQVISDESTTSPRSVLPEPLDQTYTLSSENSDLPSAGELTHVIPAPESSQNHLVGGDRNIIESDEQYEASEQVTQEASSSDVNVSLINTQNQTEDSY